MEPEKEVAGVAQDPAALEMALNEALAERNRLWEQAQRANALEHDLAQIRLVLDDIKGSVSWRVTAPLRDLKDAIAPRARATAELTRKARARLRS